MFIIEEFPLIHTSTIYCIGFKKDTNHTLSISSLHIILTLWKKKWKNWKIFLKKRRKWNWNERANVCVWFVIFFKRNINYFALLIKNLFNIDSYQTHLERFFIYTNLSQVTSVVVHLLKLNETLQMLQM